MHKDQQRTSFFWILLCIETEHSFQIKKRSTNQSLNYNKAYIKWIAHFLLLIWTPCISFLWARVEKQFQFYLEFLGFNVVVLKNLDLLVILECVDNNSPSLKVYLQKTRLKENVEHVEEGLTLEKNLKL
jgi:hypothetical protein